MRRAVVVFVLVLMAAALLLSGLRGAETPEHPPPSEKPEVLDRKQGVVERHRPQSTAEDPSRSESRSRQTRALSSAEREKVLRGIHDALSRGRSADDARASSARPSDASSRDRSNDEPSKLIDRSNGELGTLVTALNDDFMPLVDECYEQARAVSPELSGMLDLQVRLVADPEYGALVESIEHGVENEIVHPELDACIRETLLSTLFPVEEERGATDMRITLRFEPPP